MSVERLSEELGETLRQWSQLVDGVIAALEALQDPARTADDARRTAAARILVALQGHDRIEQRCRSLLNVADSLAAGAMPDDAWDRVGLDELRRAAPAPRVSGEVELF